MLLLLALLIVGVLVARVANRPPPAASVQAYRGAVAEVLEVGIRGDTLVVVVESSWAKKAESKRLQDVDSLEGTVAGEPINRIVVEDRTRARLAELNENGTSLFSP